MMQRGAYSMKYTVLHQQDDLSRDREALEQNMQRSRRMHLETSKRRKALAVKRRQDADREERRRQEILVRRREGIKAATEKYQRLNKNYTPKSDAEIKAQLHANQTHSDTPGLEEALRAVRGSSHYRSGSAASLHGNPGAIQGTSATLHGPLKAQHDNKYLQSAQNYYQHTYQGYKQGTNANSGQRRVQSAVTRHEMRPTPEDTNKHRDLQNNSLRNVTNSRSLFEQQLEQQQHQQAEQQKDLLHNFSSAINRELDTGKISSDQKENSFNNNSSCSVDSLEGGTNQTPHTSQFTNGALGQSRPVATVTSTAVTFTSHRPTNSPIAVVTPSVIRRSASDSSLVQQATNGARPYNKNDYDNRGNNVHSDFSQDSLEHKPGDASKTSPYLENYGASANSAAHVAQYQREAIVNTVGIEHLGNRYGTRPSSAIHEQEKRAKAWVTPNNDDIREFAKTAQANPLMASGKTMMTRPENNANGYHLHDTNNVGSQSKAVPVRTDPGTYSVAQACAPYANTSVSNTMHDYSHSSAYSHSHYNHATNSTYSTAGQSQKQPEVFKLGANNPVHPQPTSYTGQYPNVSTYDLNRDPIIPANNGQTPSSTYNFNYNSSVHHTADNSMPTSQSYATSSMHADRYGASIPSSVSNGYNANAYSGNPNAVPSSNQQQSGNHSSSAYQNGNQIANGHSNATSVASRIPANTSVSNSHHSTKPSPATNSHSQNGVAKSGAANGANAPSNAHVRITIPAANPRAAHRPSAALTREDPSKIPRPKNPPMEARRANTVETENHQIPPSPANSSDVEEESHPEPTHPEIPHLTEKRVKGILKKPASATYPRKPDAFGVRGTSSSKGMQRSMSAHASMGIRDSIDVTREQLSDRSQKRKFPRKKSVRFWDEHVEEEATVESDEESVPDNYAQEQVVHKPPRPVSAKLGASTNYSSKPDPRANRAMSAGAARRGPFLRPHPPPNPPSGRATMGATRPQPKSADTSPPHAGYNPPATSTYSSNAYADRNGGANYSDIDKSIDAVYDANGLRLDRTPTDDEINWLWDKVRTCLDRDGSNNGNNAGATKTTYNTEAPNQYNNPRNSAFPQNAQGAGMNTKYIDGNAIAPQYRAQQRVRPSSGYGQGGNIPRPVSGPVKKVSMDTLNNFNRRQSLLNRKTKEQGTINYHQPEGNSAVLTSVQDLNSQRPVHSEQVPSTSATTNGSSFPNHVTESLAAFMTAEQMVAGQKSVSESQVEQAMQDAQARQAQVNSNYNARNQGKVPSALSIEEQRLIQSLERLNERLKVNETGVSNAPVVQVFEPKPPVYQYGGFKGRQPITSNHTTKRFVSPNGTVPRHNYRVSSAGGVFPPGSVGYTQHRYK